jgi:hypothetical protein
MKKINFLLYQNLIESDFLILNTKETKKQSLSNTLIKNQKFLDIFIVIKEINQFISLIRHLKKNKGLIKILDNNLEENSLLFEKLNTKEFNLEVVETFLTKTTYNKYSLKTIEKTKILLNITTDKFADNLARSFFKHSFFLMQFINLDNMINNWGFYKIFNDIQSYKNLIFVTLLIKKV